MPRTRSAEEICPEKLGSVCDDLKGYASDSTISHPAINQDHPRSPHRRKRKCKERERGGGGEQQQEVHHTKTSPPPRVTTFPPLNLGMFRMKSTGSILNTPDCTPTSVLCESRESILSDVARHRHKTSAHRRPSRPEPSHAMLGLRRGSVDNGVGRVCGACGNGLSACKPPRRGAKARDDPRHQGPGKERTLRCRHLSRSLKGEKDRNHKPSHHEAEEEHVRKCSLNRSLSFSSVGDYEGTRARANFEPIHSSTSGSKWIVYGFF